MERTAEILPVFVLGKRRQEEEVGSQGPFLISSLYVVLVLGGISQNKIHQFGTVGGRRYTHNVYNCQLYPIVEHLYFKKLSWSYHPIPQPGIKLLALDTASATS